jgi:hypothetical protein
MGEAMTGPGRDSRYQRLASRPVRTRAVQTRRNAASSSHSRSTRSCSTARRISAAAWSSAYV